MNARSASTRHMATLAMIAALLLALVPTASRIIASVVPTAQPVLMELCTGAGTRVVDVSPFIAAEAPPPVATTASMTGEACGYCALLPLLSTAVPALAAWVPLASRSASSRAVAPVLPWPRNRRGLGSQAPPVTL